MRQRCYEMQHEIDILECDSSALGRPGPPARYGANPISSLCTSYVTKCNTKSDIGTSYRSSACPLRSEPNWRPKRKPCYEMQHEIDISERRTSVLRATRTTRACPLRSEPISPSMHTLFATSRKAPTLTRMLRDVTPNPQESAHRPLQPRPPSCGCEHPFHGNGNGDLLSLTSSPCVHPPPAPIPIPPCTEPQPRPHPITRPKNIPIPPLFNYLPPFPYSPETAPSRRDATLLTEVPVRCSHFHAPVRQSPYCASHRLCRPQHHRCGKKRC